MAGKTRSSEMILKFDWLELLGYTCPTYLVLFRAWTLWALKTNLIYFFLIYIIFPILELYAPKYSKNHSDKEQRLSA